MFHGAPVYIHLTIEGSSSNRNATTRIFSEDLELFVYEEFGAGGRWITYNFSEGEISTFQQYTDANGRLRTLFNADINGRLSIDNPTNDAEEYYQLLFLMIGDGEIAGIEAFTRDEVTNRSVELSPGTESRLKRETYNENGQLIVAEHVGDELQPFRYPMMMLARNGYTLMRDENTFTWDSDGGALPEGTVVEAVNTYEYQIWTGGKNFEDQPVDIFQTGVAIAHLDVQPKIDAVQEALFSWMTDLTEAHGINGTTDILTFNPVVEELLVELGHSAIVSDISENKFPVPNP